MITINRVKSLPSHMVQRGGSQLCFYIHHQRDINLRCETGATACLLLSCCYYPLHQHTHRRMARLSGWLHTDRVQHLQTVTCNSTNWVWCTCSATTFTIKLNLQRVENVSQHMKQCTKPLLLRPRVVE